MFWGVFEGVFEGASEGVSRVCLRVSGVCLRVCLRVCLGCVKRVSRHEDNCGCVWGVSVGVYWGCKSVSCWGDMCVHVLKFWSVLL